jgi:hypothetical protein
MPFEFNAHEIIERCKVCIPVNARVEAAVAAHRIAFAEYQQYGGRDARRLAMYALRAIIAASTPSADDHRAQLDYLSELPEAAWESWNDVSVLSSREETLAWIARNISLS